MKNAVYIIIFFFYTIYKFSINKFQRAQAQIKSQSYYSVTIKEKSNTWAKPINKNT